MSKPLNFSRQRLTAYSPAILKHNSGNWSIEFYAYSPVTEALEHRRIRLNRLRKSYKSTAAFKRHANEIVCELNIQLAGGWLAGGWSPFGETINSRLYTPLAEAMAEYLDEKRRELRPDSMRSYDSLCRHFGEYLQKELPGIRTGTFNRVHAVSYLDYCYKKRKLSARSWNNQLKGIRALFSWLLQKCYIKENPFVGIKRKREESKRRSLVPADCRRLIAEWSAKNNPRYLIVCELVFNALLRPMEITRIRVGNVDLEKKLIHIPSSETKTHFERDVALSDSLVERLRGLHLEKYPAHYYVLGQGYKTCGTQMLRSRLSKDWITMRDAVGLPKTMQLYSLRDSGITSLLDSGVSARTVMLAADHHDLGITTRYASSKNPDLIEKLNKCAVKF